MSDAETIARGGRPRWEQTFNHDQFGELTFSVEKIPTGQDWLTIAGVAEQIAPGVTQGSGMMLAEAIAGLLTIVKLPVIREEWMEDPNSPGHKKGVQVTYDPLKDERWEFPVVVWSEFVRWRGELLSEATKDEIKNSSGATDGNTTVAPSPESTD